MEIKNLNDATSISGGKASGLALLNKMGVPVPSGFVINNTLNLTFNNEEVSLIEKYLKNLDSKKKISYKIICLCGRWH